MILKCFKKKHGTYSENQYKYLIYFKYIRTVLEGIPIKMFKIIEIKQNFFKL